MKIITLAFFGILMATQARAQICRECNTVSQKNIMDMSNLNLMLEGMGLQSVNLKNLQEGMAPEKEVKVPAVFKNKKDDEKAIFDVNHTSDDHAAVYFVFRVPPAASLRSEGRNQVTIESTATNTHINAATLTRKDDPTQSRYQKIDTVGQTTRLNLEAGDKQNEISVSLRFYEMMGKPDLAFYPVSDAFIEKFHSRVVGADDPYNRKEQGFDRVIVDMRDLQGNEFKGKEGELYILPVVVKRGFYQTLQESPGSRTTLNYGVQGQIPVSRTFAQTGAGVYGNLAHHQKISDNKFLSFATGAGLNIQKSLSGYSPWDEKAHVSFNASLAAAFTCIDPKDQSKKSVVVSASVESPFLKDDKYNAVASRRFIDQQSSDAARKPDMALGIHYVYESKESTFSVGCTEDFGGYKRPDGRRTMDGRNNRDFTCTMKIGKKF